ncbi:histone deacetylase family protein [Enhygromyxa salina]|uniref:histone deacetylase family protein n=1 Tax=Enhygromyxa salina TaxID=215803 RepID=UPI00069730DD|nr:histone deacetylase family protein [Enhygromyxa salina]
MSTRERTPVFFNPLQLEFKPRYEWAFGEKIAHPETTARAESILTAVGNAREDFEVREPKPIPASALRGLHSLQLLNLYATAEQIPEDTDFYPTVFPKLKRGEGDPNNIRQAGAFCFDSGTPLNAKTLSAATWSAACARSAADTLRKGAKLAYALSRPPGHHAQRDLFGGYCYFNNSGVAAKVLRRAGRVVVLDIDFHHGNGTQSLFLRDEKVLTISLHGDPREYFPFFCGFASEVGEARGRGYNMNLVLEPKIDGAHYIKALEAHAIPAIEAFEPDYLVLAAGLDAYERDPIGDFKLTTEDFFALGERIGCMGIPVAAIQEGGYYTEHLGRNAVALLRGLRAGLGLAE